jgi:hypothetical protein
MKNSITQERVDAQIIDVEVSTIFDKVTVVAVRLRNGFVLVESAGAVDKANYSEEVGREICLERIKNKIWELEGYLLSSTCAAAGAEDSLAEMASALCQEIERLPASPGQTTISIVAESLALRLRSLP